MNRHIPALALILVVQLGIVAAVLFAGAGGADEGAGLLDFERDAVTRIEITDGEGRHVALSRGESGWQLPDMHALPAAEAKVGTLLDKLSAAEAAWPVATSEATAERFEVGEATFQRHLQLFADDAVVADVYLGTSPGFRKVHARRAGADDVFAIELSNFEAPAEHGEWLDKQLVQPGPVSRVAAEVDGSTWVLSRQESAWMLADLADDEQTDQEQARDWITKLENLRVQDVADGAIDDDWVPVMTFDLGEDGAESRYVFYQPETDGDFVLAAPGYDVPFAVAAYQAEPLRLTRPALIVAPEAEAEAEAESEVTPDAAPRTPGNEGAGQGDD